MNQNDALITALATTVMLMLVNRGFRRFNLTVEMKVWMGLAWLLIFATGALIARAVVG